eukprot:1631767-Ditylum_brightwellii.AAC.1
MTVCCAMQTFPGVAPLLLLKPSVTLYMKIREVQHQERSALHNKRSLMRRLACDFRYAVDTD